MHLTSLSFKEFLGTPREWSLEEASLGEICLVVGRNSAGKTRLLNVINGLSHLLRGERMFSNGVYKARFNDGAEVLSYELEIAGGQVLRELLAADGKELLRRGEDGKGEIWAAELNQKMHFQSPSSVIAAQARVDSIQHPFLSNLNEWAKNVRHYQFGTSLGRERLLIANDLAVKSESVPKSFDASAVTMLYVRAFELFQEAFDRAILDDLASLGYQCTDVGVEAMDPDIIAIQGPPLVHLFLKEKDLPANTSQISMSAGMFRALALVIHLNDCTFRKIAGTLLIDDIGEGLDFARSQACIRLLIERAKKYRLQILMTTNDRFVMNGVPLEYWNVLHRVGGKVSLINKASSPKVFSEFEDLGLNNFDFFSTNFFEQGLQ